MKHPAQCLHIAVGAPDTVVPVVTDNSCPRTHPGTYSDKDTFTDPLMGATQVSCLSPHPNLLAEAIPFTTHLRQPPSHPRNVTPCRSGSGPRPPRDPPQGNQITWGGGTWISGMGATLGQRVQCAPRPQPAELKQKNPRRHRKKCN